jgi:acylphosphatase
MATARHVTVTGRVQGVFFRVWTKEQADALGISGWVRNCPDGDVEAHLEGDAEAVQQMIEAMRRGPDGAKVEQLDVDDAPVGQADGFAIRH